MIKEIGNHFCYTNYLLSFFWLSVIFIFSHASDSADGRSVGPSLVSDQNTSATIGWIAMTVGTHIHVTLRMNSNTLVNL